MRERIVWFVNHAPTFSEKLSKKVSVPGGVKTLTVTWQSKKSALLKAISVTGWLMEQFPEQTDQIMQLKKDKDQLENMMIAEEAGAREALAKAKAD